MKRILFILLLLVIGLSLMEVPRSKAADEATTFQTTEYATIRWAGRENTHLIRPNGKVDKLRPLLEKFPHPAGVDERAYYMNIAMNSLAREGYEFAGMTSDEIVMKRPIQK
jgi:hypothetical protein